MRHRAHVLGAVGEAVAFLEDFINELHQDADEAGQVADGLSPDTVRLMAAYWRSTNNGKYVEVRKRYDMARVFAGQPEADAGRSPNDDVRYVIDLRNWSVHYRPRGLSDANPHNVIDHVRRRFPDNALMASSNNAWFSDHALGAGCEPRAGHRPWPRPRC